MTWTVVDREKAIRKCEPTFLENGKQCLNCKHSRDSVYMARECVIWCCDVYYDEVCDKHESNNTKDKERE